MVLYNELIVGRLYPKRTKYDFWKDICPGDRLIIGVVISPKTCFRGKSYQNKMMVRNVNLNTEFVNYPASVLKYLSQLDLQMVQPISINIENAIQNGMSDGYRMKDYSKQLVSAFTKAFNQSVNVPLPSSLPF